MFGKVFLFSVLLISVSQKAIKCDQNCESLIPDAITELQNGSIVVFSGEEVWLFDRENKQLSGPSPINELFPSMEGPIDAAVTFENMGGDTSYILEFKDASLYFGGGKFYTFKNLKPYQVEYGSLVYFPVRGEQSEIGSLAENGDNTQMAKRLSAAYFDPLSHQCKFIFPDNSIVGYGFELGAEVSIGRTSTLQSEFKKFGISELPTSISAALTLRDNDKKSKVFLFEDSNYCEIEIDVTKKDQNCSLKPVSEFFGCNSLSQTKSASNGGINARFPVKKGPIQVPTQEKEDQIEVTPSSQTQQAVKVRDSGSDSKPRSPEQVSSGNRLICVFVFLKLIPLILFFKTV